MKYKNEDSLGVNALSGILKITGLPVACEICCVNKSLEFVLSAWKPTACSQ